MTENIQSNEYDKPVEEPAVIVEERYRTLKNGAVYDLERGRIAKGPPPENQLITRENAREFHAMRERKKLEAAELAIIEGAKAKDLPGGIKTLTAALVDIILNSKNDRARVVAFEKLFQFVNMWPDRRAEGENDRPGDAKQLTLQEIRENIRLVRDAKRELEGIEQEMTAVEVLARDASG